MSAKPKKPAVDAVLERARRLAQRNGAEPERLLAWALRADGRVVIITAEGKKYIE